MKKALPLLALLLLVSHTALAANDAKLIGTFDNWKAYTFEDGKSKVCFMSAKPTEEKSKTKIKKRGDVLLFITHWAGDKEKNVVSISAGYPYKTDGEAVLAIDGQTFNLATQGETAWTRDQDTDDAITAAIRKGSSLKVTGASRRGTQTTDVYSLKGSGAAYDAISKECNF